MRKGMDCDFVYDDKEQIIGLNLGADYCAEHEWGIDGIKKDFGIYVDPAGRPFASWWKSILGIRPPMGIEKRAISICPENLLKGEGMAEWTDYDVKPKKVNKAKVYYIGYKNWYLSSQDKHEIFKSKLKEIYHDGKKEIWGWWCENSFMVATTNKEIVDNLYQAFQDKDIVIMLGGGGAFQNSGLGIIQKSKIPTETVKGMSENDIDAYELKQAAVKTGIYDRLEKSGKKFYALSPRWKDDKKKEVSFWLNPQQQDIYNHGWYTVDVLDQWAKNEGVIIKVKENAK